MGRYPTHRHRNQAEEGGPRTSPVNILVDLLPDFAHADDTITAARLMSSNRISMLKTYIRPLTTSRTFTVRRLPPRLERRDKRLRQPPFFVGQVARIAQPAAVIATPIFIPPHRPTPQRINLPPMIHKQF